MASVLGQDGGEGDVSPQVSCKPQAGDFREEVVRGQAVGRRTGLQEEGQDSGQVEARQDGNG